MNKKGFIQIPLLITMVIGLTIIASVGYFETRQYQKHQTEKLGKERTAQQKEQAKQNNAHILAQAQQKDLEEAKSEIEKLKKVKDNTNKQENVLTSNFNGTDSQKNLIISASELAPYLSGIARIECNDTWGSGTLWKRKDLGFTIMTNHHVIKDQGTSFCIVLPDEKIKDGSLHAYTIGPSSKMVIDSEKDIAIIQLSPIISSDPVKPLNGLNYSIGTVRFCDKKVLIGSPVMTVGFPAFAVKSVDFQGQAVNNYSSIVSNGIISGYDNSVNNQNFTGGTLSFQNYFISAKIDSGNSGGIAFSKDQDGLCVLGVPTWLTVGNYETQGLVQNIHNIMQR